MCHFEKEANYTKIYFFSSRVIVWNIIVNKIKKSTPIHLMISNADDDDSRIYCFDILSVELCAFMFSSDMFFERKWRPLSLRVAQRLRPVFGHCRQRHVCRRPTISATYFAVVYAFNIYPYFYIQDIFFF